MDRFEPSSRNGTPMGTRNELTAGQHSVLAQWVNSRSPARQVNPQPTPGQRVIDPLSPGRIARRQTIQATLTRMHGSIRHSGRRVRQKARTINRSIRYAASRPILPYELIGETDADGRRFTSEHEYFARQIEEETQAGL